MHPPPCADQHSNRLGHPHSSLSRGAFRHVPDSAGRALHQARLQSERIDPRSVHWIGNHWPCRAEAKPPLCRHRTQPILFADRRKSPQRGFDPVSTKPLSPFRQVVFHQMLVAARKSVLMDALSETLAQLDPNITKKQILAYVPASAQKLLAAAGIRDHYVFPVPAA